MERAKKGEGLDRWLRMDRKKRREEAARLAALAKLGALFLELRPRWVWISAENSIRLNSIDLVGKLDKAARELSLLPEVESK